MKKRFSEEQIVGIRTCALAMTLALIPLPVVGILLADVSSASVFLILLPFAVVLRTAGSQKNPVTVSLFIAPVTDILFPGRPRFRAFPRNQAIGELPDVLCAVRPAHRPLTVTRIVPKPPDIFPAVRPSRDSLTVVLPVLKLAHVLSAVRQSYRSFSRQDQISESG